MKHKRNHAVFAIALGIAITGAQSSFAQDFPAPKPADEHKLLAQESGVWDSVVKLYLAGPDAPPEEYKGEEKGELVCGGLYLKTVFHSRFGETDFEGHGLLGYDAKTGEYVGTWVDSFSAAPTHYKAKYDAEKKTLVALITAPGPDGAEMKMKQVTTFIDATSKKMEQFLLIEGAELKLMEIVATKKE